MRKIYLLTCLTSLAVCLTASAGTDYRLMFQSGAFTPAENVQAFIAGPSPDASEMVNGYYYRLIQFHAIPSQEQKNAVLNSGIILLEYMPRQAFVAAIPANYNRSLLAGFDVRSVLKSEPYQKINRNLFDETPAYAKVVPGFADLHVQYYGNIDEAAMIGLASASGKVLSYTATNHVVTLRIPENKIRDLAGMSWVYFIEAIAAPSEPEDTKGRSLHRSNNINVDMPIGRHYNGAGVAAALADDGFVGPHIDFTGRITNHVFTTGATHGDMTSGILAGAGNLDPTIRGMADGVTLHVFSINNYTQIIDAVANNSLYGTVVSSTSYSQGCNEYTSDTQFGDQTTKDNPQLLFVFSAGNNAGGDCSYGTGAGWGNITGGYKQGKNVIACANLDALEVRDNTSSRGPASDGRVKPDISSNGKDEMSTDENNTYQVGGGTSAACPGIAGISTQLIQAYKQLNSATDAPTALIKACLLNSAEDIGNAGPDYTYGYGRVNALRAVKTMENNTYFHDSIAQGATNIHTINVPANVVRLKVMVYWHDQGGNPAASTALINDIDMTVTEPSLASWNPWVLDPTPVVANITAPATRGVDHLNNMEQVTLDNPAAGAYTVTLNGGSIPSGPQEYFLVYEFIYDDIAVTYPIGGEGFVPSTTEVIRWDALRNATPFDLEYSTDNGGSWNLIASGISGSSQQYSWAVPASITDQAKVRVTRGSTSGMNADNFTILGKPTGITVNWCCPDSIKLSWSAVAGATGYEISQLGANYMDSIGTSATTSFIVTGTNPSSTYWFSVRAILANGKGQRALAIVKNPGAFNCPLSMDAHLLSLVSPASGSMQDCQGLTSVPVTVLLENTGFNPLSNIPVKFSLNSGPVVTDLYTGTIGAGLNASFTFAATVDLSVAGSYDLRVWTDLPGDMNIYNDSAASATTTVAGVLAAFPFNEDFETFTLCSTASDCEATVCTPLNGWVQDVNLSGDDIDFRTAQGATPSGSTGPDVDHTFGNTTGNYMYLEASTCLLKQADLITPCINLTGIVNPELSFWYHMYGASMGSLHVDAFSNGTWVNDITPVLTGNHGNIWLQRLQDLSAYSGQIINLRFRGITGNDYTSDMAIDDIGVDYPTGIVEHQASSGVSVYPNPTEGIFNLSIAKPGNYQVDVYDMNGKIVNSAALHTSRNDITRIDMSGFAKGIYTVVIRGSETLHARITVM